MFQEMRSEDAWGVRPERGGDELRGSMRQQVHGSAGKGAIFYFIAQPDRGTTALHGWMHIIRELRFQRRKLALLRAFHCLKQVEPPVYPSTRCSDSAPSVAIGFTLAYFAV